VSAAGRHAELSLAGGRIALGCDSENAGDAVDPLRVIALAAGIAKDQVPDPTRFGAHAAFEWATIGGAEAIGMADQIGSLEVGKRADVVVHDTSSLVWTPRSADPVLQLVWAASGSAVREVLVDGRLVVRDGRCASVDHDALRAAASVAAPALLARAGIEPPSRWPVV
jgi:5-methylthioadenosine/S-adenosylhomocysteine deaminase